MVTKHSWKFFRAGGFDQVRLESGSDLMALGELDQKFWVALACPTTGLEFDSKTLALLDTDGDGRIRVPELIAAIKWAGRCLKNKDDLLKGAAELPLGAIDNGSQEGKAVLASAKHLLARLGKSGATVVTLEDTADTARMFAPQFNGDGIVPADSAGDEATKAVIHDIIACFGPDLDRSGKPGVTQPQVERFFAEAQAYSDWWNKAESDSTILPLAGATANAAGTFNALRPKIDDYFTRCLMAAFDPRSVNALNREEKEYLVFAGKDLSLSSAEIAGFPLSQVAAGKPLPLGEGLNPAWAGTMAKFTAEVVRPLLNGKSVLTEQDWGTLSGKFAPYEAWLASKAGASVEKLGLLRVREILAGKAKETILALIVKDKALEPEPNSIATVERLIRCRRDPIATVERLIRYHRDLYKLANNFVSFHDFYSRKDNALFQAGTLYLDQRSCELCLPVEDSGKHALMAGLAGTYLAYCDCVHKATGEKMQIVAAITAGDSDNLTVGRKGIFYDRKGRDWDATISKILDNPISLRQAFWAPYKKAARMLQERIAKPTTKADQAVPAAALKPKLNAGLTAALGAGAAALGGLLGALMSAFLNVRGLMPLGMLAAILLISGPPMLLAWLKLRRRNLGPILDANGWVMNCKVKINVPFGAALTKVASLPPGAPGPVPAALQPPPGHQRALA